MKKDFRSFVLCLVIAALAIGTVASAADKSASAATFDMLASLVGDWKGELSGTEVTLTYTLTANGTALMEEFRPKTGGVMITMFTVDGDHLVATHYCALGNQPHMKTGAITDPQTKEVVFSLDGVTGMATPEDWHNTGLRVILEDKDHLTQEWTYLAKGETGKSVFHFTRKS